MASIPLEKVRNIGISAHIDSGKTTLTERILFYTGKIHKIEEVRGKSGVGAKMDSMDLEREKGITIQSAATYCEWNGLTTSTSSTPPATSTSPSKSSARSACSTAPILVLVRASGVQSQSITVDRQMKRYNVPRLAFVNKMDRAGANPSASPTSSRRSCATTPVTHPDPDRRRGPLRGHGRSDHAARPSTSTATTARTSARKTIPADRSRRPRPRRNEMIAADRRRRRRAWPRSS